MSTLLLTAVLALGAGEEKAKGGAAAAAEGKWLIVYADEGGRRNNAWENRPALLSKGVLSYKTEDDKKRSMKLHFGQHQKLEVTVGSGEKAKAKSGVYILGQDYLCISLSRGGDAHTSSGDFILILRRQRGKTKE